MLPFLSAFDGLHISMAPEELFAPEASSQAQTTAASGKKNKKNKKNKKKAKNSAPPPPDPPTTPSTPTPSSDNNDKKKKKKTGSPSIVLRFDTYFGSGALSDWQRLCRDVGLEGEYPSKNQCRKALKTVHVNICDLMDAVKAGRQVKQFQSEGALAKYCRSTRKIYPKIEAKMNGPVRHLLRLVF